MGLPPKKVKKNYSSNLNFQQYTCWMSHTREMRMKVDTKERAAKNVESTYSARSNIVSSTIFNYEDTFIYWIPVEQ